MHALTAIRIVVTRAAHQANELASPLRDLGAEVILLPAIEIGPPSDSGPLRRAAAQCDEYDWIIFTSANSVTAFMSEMHVSGRACRARIATGGAATREAAEKQGFRVSLTPEKYVAESLVEVFASEDLHGRRILIPSAAVTRDVVADELRKRGADVQVVEAYRNVVPSELKEDASAIFREPYPEWVTFASSSAVDHLIEIVGIQPLRHVKIASIGPITSETVRKHGLQVTAEAGVHNVPGLIEAILAGSSHNAI